MKKSGEIKAAFFIPRWISSDRDPSLGSESYQCFYFHTYFVILHPDMMCEVKGRIAKR